MVNIRIVVMEEGFVQVKMTDCSKIACYWWKNIWGWAQSISSSHVPGSCMGNLSIAGYENKDTTT